MSSSDLAMWIETGFRPICIAPADGPADAKKVIRRGESWDGRRGDPNRF